MPLDCGCTVVQKTHEHYNDWASAKNDFDGRVILVIRYDAINILENYNIFHDNAINVYNQKPIRYNSILLEIFDNSRSPQTHSRRLFLWRW